MSNTIRTKAMKKISEFKENQIEAKLVKMLAHYDYEKSKLLELISYRKEYEDRQRSSISKGISAMEAYQQRLFIAQISSGIERQQELLVRLDKELDQKMQDWKMSHLKTKAVDAVLSRYQQVDLQKENRLEQKEQDERLRFRTRVRNYQ